MGIIDPDGILNACTTNTRMAKANSIATMIASAYSRTMDFRPDCVHVVRKLGSRKRGLLSSPRRTRQLIHISLILIEAHSSPTLKMARNASCGTSTLPTAFIRFFPSFCFSSNFRFRVMSPP